MMRRVCMVMMAVLAGCGDNLSAVPGVPVNPADPDVDASVDAPVDPPIDAPPTNLTKLCGAEPMTLDDWEDCYQKRWCEWEVGCLPLNTYRDVQECIEKSDAVEGGRLAAERRGRERAVEQERASLDVAAFTQCLVETSGAYCNTARLSVACANRFTGKIADGGTCYADAECASPGAVCESSCTDDACCLGTCRPKFKQGQMCDEYDSCEPGLRCHHVCWSGNIGSSCINDRDCDPNAWCNAGHCDADFAQDAACTNTSQCGGETSCIGLSIIDSSPGSCGSISKVGDRCDYFCYGNLYCDASGTCRALPGLGQSCPGFTPCVGVDTVCSDGQCVLLGDSGSPCSRSQLCRPGWFCTSELNDPNPICVLPRDQGQPCADPSHCKSYQCSGNIQKPGMCLPWSDTCPLDGAR